MRRIGYIILGLVLMTSCKEKTSKGILKQDSIPVKVSPVIRDTISTTFESSGYFTTDSETPLSFKNGGVIDKIYVHEGDSVSDGQLLATVKAVEARSSAQQAELSYKKAQRDYKRAVNLYKDSVATLESMQNARTALKVAKQQRASATFNQQQSEIRASGDGYVLKRYLHEGQLAGPGAPVLLVNSTAGAPWLFKTDVSDGQWAALQVGDSAKVRTDFDQKNPMKAKVFRKNKGVDPETGGFNIQLKLEAPAGALLATGLFGEATLYPSRKRVAWRIPYEALLDGDADKGFVFITNDKSQAQKIRVHVSAIHHNYVLIDRGLEEAKYLITSGSAYLNDGSTIKIVEK